MTRHATVTRQTRETAITLTLNLDGQGQCEIATGLGFFDHMLECLAKHAGWDLQLKATGDLQVDDHHTVEDCAIVLGKAVGQALDKRQSIQRFGSAYAPLDEALSRAVIDLATRVTAIISLNLNRENIGDVACENISLFFGRWRLKLA
jgi:imidazoleglycerol-phosphate dehydratase